MTTVPVDSSSAPRNARLIAFWLIAQLAALALAASRISVSARFFQPAERMAVEEMLVIQLMAAALTFPLLLQNLYLACVVMITAIPMLLLANTLSRYALAQLLPVVGYLELCLLAMATWAHLLRNLRSQLIGIIASTTLILFSLVLWYLSREYQPDSTDWLQYASPLVTIIRILDQSGKIWAFAAIPTAFLVTGIVALLLSRARRSVI
jgi:glycerol uptake facilitator-like aquaporin